MSAATIDDVARAAGVSRQTVTRAVNDMTGISAATRERVLRAAAELDHRPSRSGRAMVRGRHDTLGIAVSDLTDPFHAPWPRRRCVVPVGRVRTSSWSTPPRRPTPPGCSPA